VEVLHPVEMFIHVYRAVGHVLVTVKIEPDPAYNSYVRGGRLLRFQAKYMNIV
jgi:hypothetical protein